MSATYYHCVLMARVRGPDIGNRLGPNSEQSTKTEFVTDLVVVRGSTGQEGQDGKTRGKGDT